MAYAICTRAQRVSRLMDEGRGVGSGSSPGSVESLEVFPIDERSKTIADERVRT
jgi:hypothetical protein